MKKITISILLGIIILSFYAKPVKAELFDNCDEIDNWKYTDTDRNLLIVDSTDKVEGTASLKGVIASGYGGMFYKNPTAGYWNLSETPLIRMWMKLNKSVPGLKFELVTDPGWNSFKYEILDQLAIGEWKEIVIDLRLPDEPEGMLPNLSNGIQISFFTWDLISESASINWDNITLERGPYISPRIAISPLHQTVEVNETVSFSAVVLGGLPPYNYKWYVDGELKGTTASFLFNSSFPGKYNVTCMVIDSVGNSTSASTNITVVSLPLSPPFPPSSDILKSEVRGMFIQPGWYIEHNWTLIAETCKKYGINTIVLEISLGYLWENGRPKYYPTLKTAIDAFHKQGFNVYLLSGPGGEWGLNSSTRAVDSKGNYVDYLSFTKNISRTILLTLYSYIAENYEFEGFIFDDNTGYNGQDIDYSEEARLEFIRETGKTDVNWPSDVIEGGKYWTYFVEWRMDEVTEFVELVRNAIKAKKPNALFSMAAFAPLRGGDYWAYAYAQHVADWIDKGFLDFVSPMIGTRTLYGFDSVDERCNLTYEYFLGTKEGKIPFIPFTLYTLESDPRPIDNWVQAVQIMKSYGVDGWILWRYGGPGWNRAGYSDVRPYIVALAEAGLMEPVWAIQNLSLIINQENNQTQISWITTVPTKSKIEYSSSKLFNGTVRYSGRQFHFKDIDYLGGTIQEDSSFKTIHSFTLPIGTIKEFRVQSIDSNNTKITSYPFSFSDLLNLSVNGKIGPRINITFQTFYKGINVSYVTSTDSEGNYRLYLMPSLYDILYYTNNFWLKQISTSIYSNAYNKLNSLKFYPEKTSLSFDITNNQTVQVYSEKKPLRVLKNSFYLEERSSLEDLLNSYGWFYNESEKVLYIKFSS